VNKKLPPDAFAKYLALGFERSYLKVAEHFGVSKRTVQTAAVRERWQQRVTEADEKARDKVTESYVETVQQMNDRHLKVLRFVLGRGLEGLKSLPVGTFGEAVRAVTIAIEKERLIRGEATERMETVEQIVQRESKRFLTSAAEDDWGDERVDGTKDSAPEGKHEREAATASARQE
jgi:hypothetical protein